ncbi:nucleoside 2-deoxyribosyltransferase [Gluconacetobacter aggeris]|uniref:Nucleoside 2-deoxyribosyltransferase n=1 Tax=Gluconacetobacter aggeris TaxID=1286186 RepID=A0A7W4NVY4_9PROT|nr:PfkB family carbohydrate kinase [Gluconacetobacter aggeris]MBB2168117.1 nucleoside 2-deoxyribosyltransferase [Gluconacetobacter aggeris]
MTTVVGGVYLERCIEPFWDDVYGSGGRAAAAISASVPDVGLMTYRAVPLLDGVANLEGVYGFEARGPEVPIGIAFDYFHSLATPRISPRPDAIQKHDPLIVEDDVVLRFGMLEGTARVTAKIAVYDPQSAFDPRPFGENGSTAKRLALILNRLEAGCLTNRTDPDEIVQDLIETQGAEVVVLKMGGYGALVGTASGCARVPAYRSPTVWKIGSGDVYSAAFTQFWAVEGRDPVEAADLASRATSRYCATRVLPISTADELASLELDPVVPGHGRIYIAAPFFNLAERWMVEEIRTQLGHMGVEVFSPLHDVGPGPGEVVAPLDLAGVDRCQAMIAILNGTDPGTVFEVGWARAKGIPVVALAQNMRPEDLKMVVGSRCQVVGDLVSAVYHAVWALP